VQRTVACTVWSRLAPAATPRPVREVLAAAMACALAGEALRARLAGLGADRVLALGLDATETYLTTKVTRWEALMRR
jgi:tripartite-type tricarboxylate transporter receptor subunit TctC